MWSLLSLNLRLEREDADTITGSGERRVSSLGGILAGLSDKPKTQSREFWARRLALQLWEYKIYASESTSELEKGLLAFETDCRSVIAFRYDDDGSVSTHSIRRIETKSDLTDFGLPEEIG
jgi:hypothetical protein